MVEADPAGPHRDSRLGRADRPESSRGRQHHRGGEFWRREASKSSPSDSLTVHSDSAMVCAKEYP